MTKTVSKTLPPLTESQLYWVVEMLNLKPAAVRRLKSIVVDGEKVADAAGREGLTPQAAYRLIHQVSNEFDRRLLETGKKLVMVIVDEDEVSAVRSYERLSCPVEQTDEPS